MNKEHIRIRKVHIQSFITILKDLYEKGVDFVDIYGAEGNPSDVVGLSFSKEYMNDDMVGNFEDMSFTETDVPDFKIDLSNDEDLNQLL